MNSTQTPFKAAPGPHQERMQELVGAFWRGLGIEAPSPERPLAPVARVLDECALNAYEVSSLTRRLALAFLEQRGVPIEEGAASQVNQAIQMGCAPAAGFGCSAGDGEAGGWDEPLAGFLFANGGGGAVFVRSDDPIARRRFSAAHELGHFVLHFAPQATQHFARRQSIQGIQYISADPAEPLPGLPMMAATRQSLPRPPSEAEAAHQKREEEADAFAAELLIPAALASEVAARERALWGDSDLIWRLSQQFLVSRKAMWKRLLQLGWVNAASPYDC